MSHSCDVIVLSWNQKEVTKQFVESYFVNTTYPARLIIIDNNSSDGTEEYLKQLEKRCDNINIKVIYNNKNKGFVGGMNQGIALSDAEFICLANNDLLFTKGWLAEMISVFEKNTNIGVLNPNSNNIGAKPGSGVSLSDFAKHLMENYQGTFVEMPFCIGFCMVIKRDVINRVGGLSKEFHPFFFEDTDFSMKAKQAGFLIGMAKASFVWHEEHTSVSKLGTQKEEYFTKSRAAFFKKWGKILRVAWVVDDAKDVLNNLDKALRIVRRGNFLWFFTTHPLERSSFFAKNSLTEHSGINFTRFRNRLDLLWKILKKKKGYDMIITKDRFTQNLLSRCGYNTCDTYCADTIEKIKREV